MNEIPSLVRLSFLLVAVCLLLSTFVNAQQSEKVVILNHADSLVGMEIDGEQARQLIGNVKFTQGRIVVTCDRAIQYLKSNKISMEGVVEVRDDSMRMVGMRGMYYGDTRTAEAFERVLLEDKSTTLQAAYGKYFIEEKRAYFKTNVVVEDSASTLTSDELLYYRDDQTSFADGNVQITSKNRSMVINGGHFEHYKKQQYSKMTKRPELVQYDSSADGTIDTLIIRSKIMESYQDSLERLVATDSVAIVRSGFAAEAGLSIYYTDVDSIILRNSPVIWYVPNINEDNQITGDSIFIKLQKRQLETVHVRGSAVAISRADSLKKERFNQLTGQEIIMRFSGKKLVRMDVDQTATSLYYLFDDDEPNGLNKTSGDHITFMFRQGKIERIKIIGGVEGQYFPEKMVRNNEQEYNLPGFNWRTTRPGMGTVNK